MAEVLAVCLSEKGDDGRSASGMRGILSAVRALVHMCIVPPLVGAIHRRIRGGGGAKPGVHDYATPEMLRYLWQRAASERDRSFVALVVSSWICFWRVSESASVCPFDLLDAGGVFFYRMKSGGPRGWLRRPLFKFGMSLADYPSEYRKQQGLPADQPIFSGGDAALEDCLTTLLRGSWWNDYTWHSLKRGVAASCWN